VRLAGQQVIGSGSERPARFVVTNLPTTNTYLEGGGVGTGHRVPDADEEMADCREVARHGFLALDGYLSREDTLEVAQHLQGCGACAEHVGQMAATAAVLGARPRTREIGSSAVTADGQVPPQGTHSRTFDQSQRALAALARAADPEHADDLVQETWDHFLSANPVGVPVWDELVDYLMQRIGDDHQQEDLSTGAWADSLLRHHAHNTADLAESDLPPDPGGYGSLQELADLDALDTDADRAELLFPDLYSDGPDQSGWTSPPSAWPSVTRFLGPDAEVETSELYSVVDAALDELPQDVGDAVYLVDIEGHSLQTAGGLLDGELAQLQRDLARGRRHVRARVNGYLAGR
jgi:DNA-directed RNA polymerase specialized sigma24 family protein